MGMQSLSVSAALYRARGYPGESDRGPAPPPLVVRRRKAHPGALSASGVKAPTHCTPLPYSNEPTGAGCGRPARPRGGRGRQRVPCLGRCA